MRNGKALGARKSDDDPTIRDVITPDMCRPTKAQATVRAEQGWPVLSQIAVGVILPTAMALGWWIGAEVPLAAAPALTAPAPQLEPMASNAEQRADVSDAQLAVESGDVIPVVAVTDLPLEEAEQETVEPPQRSVGTSKHSRLRAKRRGVRPGAIDAQ